MSLSEWYKNGWLKKHQTSRNEIRNLFAIIERDLKHCEQTAISEDWRFAMAYNAARQCCVVALFCSGYRVERGGSEHYRVISSLPLTMGQEYKEIRDYLDSCRNKRNVSDYDFAGSISSEETKELIKTAHELYSALRTWIKINYPDYYPF